MISENTKMLLFVAWVIAVCLVAIAIGITSVPNWIVVACVAVVPPLVVRTLLARSGTDNLRKHQRRAPVARRRDPSASRP